MAGLCQRYAQLLHPVALVLVFTLLVSQCLASLQQVVPLETSADNGNRHQQQLTASAPLPPSLRHILRRSVAAVTSANIRDSTFEKQSYNFTDVNILQRNPPIMKLAEVGPSLLKENIQTKTAVKAAPSTIEMESSGREVEPREGDSTSPFQENEYLKTKITDINAEEEGLHNPASTERTIVTASSGTTTTTEDPLDNVACPECVQRQRRLQKLDPEALRRLRIETIKMQILSKLRIEKPPNVTRGEMNIPVPLSDGQFGGGEEELIDFSGENEIGGKKYYAKTTQIIITAKDEHIYCPTKSRNAGCFEFDLTQATGMHVVSAELWVYKMASPTESINQTLVVSQLASRHSRIKKELVRQSVSLQEAGWVTFEMKHKVQNMINHSQRHQRLELFCEDCSELENDFPISRKAGYRPFLAISTSDPSPRKPRSIDCRADTTDCCRERFYVSFAEIGWDWIIQPKGYHANYCKGSCSAGPVMPGYAHTSVIHRVLSSDDQLRPDDMMPCCAPKTTKGISLIYYSDQRLIYRRELADMVIESCACS